MTQDDILTGLFPEGHDINVSDGILIGSGALGDRGSATVIGVNEGTPLGIEGAHALAGAVIDAMDRNDAAPIIVIIDSGSQRMRRRDELLGINEYLAHLAKTLRLAEGRGHPTIGLIHGHSAAGAFIATALAAQVLIGLPGANPTVMDLPSISRVTTLPIGQLEKLAQDSPVFAPGLDNMVAVGAIHGTFDPGSSLSDQLEEWLADLPVKDVRDRLGCERGGRPKAFDVGNMVLKAARET